MADRWKVTPDAATADTLAKDLGRAYAALIRVPYPLAPQFYGAGQQPRPPESAYLQFYVRPVDNLVPAPDDAIALEPVRMAGHVRTEDLSATDREKLELPAQAQAALMTAKSRNKKTVL